MDPARAPPSPRAAAGSRTVRTRAGRWSWRRGAPNVSGAASPLRAGDVARAEGEFRRGDVVEVRALDGSLVGRGVVALDSRLVLQATSHQAGAGVQIVGREHLILKES